MLPLYRNVLQKLGSKAVIMKNINILVLTNHLKLVEIKTF